MLAGILAAFTLQAQTIDRCGTDAYNAWMEKNDPSIAAERQAIRDVLLGLAGGLAGLGLTAALHRALPWLLPPDFPRVMNISIDGRVLVFTLMAALATSVACGLLAALQLRRPDLVEPTIRHDQANAHRRAARAGCRQSVGTTATAGIRGRRRSRRRSPGRFCAAVRRRSRHIAATAPS